MSSHAKKWWHKSKSHTLLFSLGIAAGIVAVASVGLYFGGKLSFLPTQSVFAPLQPVDFPSRLLIPVIGVDAIVEQVGILQPSGRMGIPSNFANVAWYKLGPKPGERGSAVIDGHLDNARDANAVFARLSELETGDIISVVDGKGQKVDFRVTGKALYNDTNAPLDIIFDQTTTGAHLNLITCDGTWNQATRNYDKRLVVYSERVN